MSDPERIWLQNAADARATGDRLWCQDKVWPECAEQQEPTEYIRADLYASRISQQDAELERVRREVEEARAKFETIEEHIMDAIDEYRESIPRTKLAVHGWPTVEGMKDAVRKGIADARQAQGGEE